MKKLREKMKSQGGFTLVEMLIVVAIIAILVAVSIPLVSSSIEEAQKATDAANERAFKSALVSSYLLNTAGMAGDGIKVEASDDTTSHIYAYNAIDGIVASSVTNGYGQSSGIEGWILYGYVKADGTVKMGWSNSALSATSAVDSAVSTCVSSGVVAP